MIRCKCGARGDAGELVEHTVSHLGDPDDPRDHGWPDEPERVTQAREQATVLAENRRRIAAAAGLTVEQYLAAR